jgi:hypothetical protein
VIVAESAEQAAALLTEQIRYIAKQVITADEVEEVDTSRPHVIVLSNGDY